jgi:DHA1 family quinolone resistance protein-like MFS transporter
LSVYLIYLSACIGVELGLIFIPLLAQEYTSSPALIGGVVAVYNFTLFLSSAIFGRLADIHGRSRFIMLGLSSSAVIFYLHCGIHDLASLFAVRSLAGFFYGIFPASILALVYEQDSRLGRFTGIGSLGFGIGSVLAGVLSAYHQVFCFAAGFFLFAFLLSISLKESPHRLKISFFSLEVVRRNYRLYLSFFLRHTGAFAIWAIYPIYLSILGADRFWIGIIYGINSFSQFLFMPILDRFNSVKLVSWGLLLSGLTFLGIGLAPGYRLILGVQVILALSWSCLYLGSLKYLMERNVERSSAVGVFNSIFALSGIIGSLLGGLVAGLGYRAVMGLAVLLTIAGFALFRTAK